MELLDILQAIRERADARDASDVCCWHVVQQSVAAILSADVTTTTYTIHTAETDNGTMLDQLLDSLRKVHLKIERRRRELHMTHIAESFANI